MANSSVSELSKNDTVYKFGNEFAIIPDLMTAPCIRCDFWPYEKKEKKNKHLISRTNHPCLLNATYTNHQSRQFEAATQYSKNVIDL
jgi:hypothetical protein